MRSGLGSSNVYVSSWLQHGGLGECCTFLLPPVIVTLTNRRVYTIRFFALPFGSFFFSWGSTCTTSSQPLSCMPHACRQGWWSAFATLEKSKGLSHLWCLRLDLAGTGEGSVNFTHDCWWVGMLFVEICRCAWREVVEKVEGGSEQDCDVEDLFRTSVLARFGVRTFDSFAK